MQDVLHVVFGASLNMAVYLIWLEWSGLWHNRTCGTLIHDWVAEQLTRKWWHTLEKNCCQVCPSCDLDYWAHNVSSCQVVPRCILVFVNGVDSFDGDSCAEPWLLCGTAKKLSQFMAGDQTKSPRKGNASIANQPIKYKQRGGLFWTMLRWKSWIAAETFMIYYTVCI